jgi:hypothetical protein
MAPEAEQRRGQVCIYAPLRCDGYDAPVQITTGFHAGRIGANTQHSTGPGFFHLGTPQCCTASCHCFAAATTSPNTAHCSCPPMCSFKPVGVPIVVAGLRCRRAVDSFCTQACGRSAVKRDCFVDRTEAVHRHTRLASRVTQLPF